MGVEVFRVLETVFQESVEMRELHGAYLVYTMRAKLVLEKTTMGALYPRFFANVA